MNLAVMAVVRFCLRLAVLLALLVVLVVSFQGALIFPAMLQTLGQSKQPRSVKEGSVFESFSVPNSDGKFVEAFRVPTRAEQRGIAVVFHGNGDTLDSALGLQRWFASLGFTNYSLEYRGVGRSEGWPTEEALERDVDRLWEEICAREDCNPQRVLIVGFSIGSGPASYLAGKVQPRALLLLAPFTSLPDVVREMPLYGLLTRFLKFKFPVLERVQLLTETSVLILHGVTDSVIPVSHARQFQEALASNGRVRVSIHERAGHGDALASQLDLTTAWITEHFAPVTSVHNTP